MGVSVAASSDSASRAMPALASAKMGIGFTVSLFIAGLAYTGAAELEAAKIGILAGSVVAAVIGLAALLAVARQRRSVDGEVADNT